MGDTYGGFAELASQEREGEDWAREYVNRGSGILVMAPHGGWIEPFTAELACSIAANDLSVYTFRGLKDRGNHRLHLTSHRFDEPLALRAVASAFRVLAIHGERTSGRNFVMVGGLWEPFRDRMSRALEEAGVSVVGPRKGLRGERETNICNRGGAGAGGQLELSEGLRKVLREDSEELFRFVELIRGVLFEFEGEAVGVERHGG